MEGVVRVEEGAEFESGFVGLVAAFWGQFYAVVGDCLVDVAVFWGRLGGAERVWDARGMYCCLLIVRVGLG